MKYSIIIPTYNHCDDLLKPCIESVFKYTDMAEVELIISANGCTDNTQTYLVQLAQKFSELGFEKNLKVVWNSEPLGYSKANNVAIKQATTNQIVLINNDIVLLPQSKSQWLNLLNHQFLMHEDCGIACVSKCHSDPAGQEFAIFFCVMIGREVFNDIGLLNEEYGKGGGEDTEFCIEAKRAGYETYAAGPQVWKPEANIYVGEFPIYHKGEGTVHDPACVSDWDEVFLTNSLKLAKKYNPDWYRWRISNYYERAVFMKGDVVFPREVTRYAWAAKNIVGKKVLEIGCSNGYGIQFMPEDIEYTGVDYDRRIIECAKDQNWGYNANFVNADINLFQLEQYDTIIAFEVIEHLDTGLEIVEKLKKHCKRLMITVPRMEPPGFWGPHHKLHWLDESRFPGFEFMYINEAGNFKPVPDDAIINLMVCKYDNPDIAQ